jgi:prepilin-type N-terminal cleavage/methylation domain-containing protein
MKNTHHGFSLVELLVVIGVIALLISILMPSLNKARQQAKIVSCASNMRQVGLAILMYANDNKGKIPAGNFYNYPIANRSDLSHDAIAGNAGDSGFIGSDLKKYLGNNMAMFLCPANSVTLEMPAATTDPAAQGMSTYDWYKNGGFNYSPAPNYSFFIYYFYFGNYPWEGTYVLPSAELELQRQGRLYPTGLSGRRAKLMQDMVTEPGPYIVYGYNTSHKSPNSLFTDGSVVSESAQDLELRPRLPGLTFRW